MKEVNPQKVNLLLVNKADMLTTEQRFEEEEEGILCEASLCDVWMVPFVTHVMS